MKLFRAGIYEYDKKPKAQKNKSCVKCGPPCRQKYCAVCSAENALVRQAKQNARRWRETRASS